MLVVDFSRAAERFSLRLPPKRKGQVGRRINALAENPYASDTRELAGFAPLRRADIGEYRIVYRVSERVLHIFLIGKRNDDEVYRKLKRMM
ncbi:MAG TPA: type II toxin-antitoxin system RelE/ParE family toxin [Candidatus Paceibacterota bacterium]